MPPESACNINTSGVGFGGNGHFTGSLGEGLFNSAPREHGAFDALGEFANALEELEVAETFSFARGFAGDDILEGFSKLGGLGAGFAFHLHRHHRGGGLADGAALAA